MMLPMRWIMLILTALPMTCQAEAALAAPLPDAAIMLQQDIQRELGPQRTRLSPRQTQRAMALGMDMLDQAGDWPANTEIILVVDRAPAVQRLWFVLADPAAHALVPLGMVAVSTGRPGRKEHFRTPVGIFFNDGQIYGYRALGTKMNTASAAMATRACGYGISAGRRRRTGTAGARWRWCAWRCMRPTPPFSNPGWDRRIPRGAFAYPRV